MSIEVTLWAILVVYVVRQVAGAKISARLRWQIKDELGWGVAWILVFSLLAMTGLWIWLAVLTGYWQFAAMAVSGLLVAVIPSGRPS